MGRFRSFAALAGAVGAGAAAAAASAWAATTVASLRPRLYRTRFGLARVFTTHTPDGRPIRVLSLGGGWQTVMYLDDPDTPAASYARGFDLVLDPALCPSPEPRVLMIGGAGCAWPRHAVTSHPTVQVTVAEVDPAIVRIAEREFLVTQTAQRAGTASDGRPRLDVQAQEGLSFLERAARQRAADEAQGKAPVLYDAIIDDAFVGREAADHLTTPYGLALVKDALAPQGLFVVNVSVPKDDPSALLACRNRLAAVFAQVACVPAIDRDLAEEENHLLVATDAPTPVPGAIVL